MGKGLVVDTVVQKYLQSISENVTYACGFLIGQKEFVVLAVRTKFGETASGKELYYLINDNDKQWIIDHAEQVDRMLPGGLSVIGMFLITSSGRQKDIQSKLTRSMLAVEAHLSEDRFWESSEEDTSERAIVYMCSTTKKISSWMIDCQNPKRSPKNVGWTYQQRITDLWPVVLCTVGIDLMIPVQEKNPENLRTCVSQGLQNWAKQIQTSVCLLNNKKLPDTAALNPPTKRKQPRPCKSKLNAEILIPTSDQLSEKQSSASLQTCSCVLKLQGTLQCRAYLCEKNTAKNAVTAIKRDVINCVSSSTKSFLQHSTYSANTFVGSQPLPQRVFALVPEVGICVCDYLYPEDSEDTARQRIKERMDIDIEKLQITQKIVSGSLQWHQDSEVGIYSMLLPLHNTEKQRKLTTGLLAAAGIALVAYLLVTFLHLM